MHIFFLDKLWGRINGRLNIWNVKVHRRWGGRNVNPLATKLTRLGGKGEPETRKLFLPFAQEYLRQNSSRFLITKPKQLSVNLFTSSINILVGMKENSEHVVQGSRFVQNICVT